MKSATLPSFWRAYQSLEARVKRSTRKAYRLWTQNPFHPSLHFKCINRQEDVWSVRVPGSIAPLVFSTATQLRGFGLAATTNMSSFSRS